MTQAFDNRIQQAIQGAMQAITQHGGESGYRHTIEIISNENRGIFIESTWRDGDVVHTQRGFTDILMYGQPLKLGWDTAFTNILKIEHARGRCVSQ